MVLTLDLLFSNPAIIKAVIDRVLATKMDEIYWKRYLKFERTKARTFKTYIGTVSGVTPGSIIDHNSNKPLRGRKALGTGVGEVADLGDRYQLDNDRLEVLADLIANFNATQPTGRESAMNTIIDFIVDDMRQAMLAPHKRMDLVLGNLRSTGKAQVETKENKNGVSTLDIELPVNELEPTKEDGANFISYLQDTVSALRASVGAFESMEMTRKTFVKNIVNASEFKDAYKRLFGSAEFAAKGGMLTEGMVNEVFTTFGLPNVKVIEDYVQVDEDKMVNAFAENRISLLPKGELGKMRHYTPYEMRDKVPGKNYTTLEGDMFISSVRTDEGRFLEYGAAWIPDLTAPNKISIINLDTVNGN